MHFFFGPRLLNKKKWLRTTETAVPGPWLDPLDCTDHAAQVWIARDGTLPLVLVSWQRYQWNKRAIIGLLRKEKKNGKKNEKNNTKNRLKNEHANDQQPHNTLATVAIVHCRFFAL